MPGLGPYMQDNAATAYNNVIAQLNFADQGGNGVQLFSYTDLLGGNAVDAEVRRVADFLAANNAASRCVGDRLRSRRGLLPDEHHVQRIERKRRRVHGRPHHRGRHGGSGSQKLTINKAGAGTFLARHVAGTGTGGGAYIQHRVRIDRRGRLLAQDGRATSKCARRRRHTRPTRPPRRLLPERHPGRPVALLRMDAQRPHALGRLGRRADGTVESRFTLDSIQFRGSEDVNVLMLDDVVFDATAVAADQWTLDSSINTKRPTRTGATAPTGKVTCPTRTGVANFLRLQGQARRRLRWTGPSRSGRSRSTTQTATRSPAPARSRWTCRPATRRSPCTARRTTSAPPSHSRTTRISTWTTRPSSTSPARSTTPPAAHW